VPRIQQPVGSCPVEPDIQPRSPSGRFEHPAHSAKRHLTRTSTLDSNHVTARHVSDERYTGLRDALTATYCFQQLAEAFVVRVHSAQDRRRRLSAAYRAIIGAVNGLGGFGGRKLAKLLGRVGIWSFALQRMAARDEIAAALRFEGLGFRATWIPESLGSKDVLAHSGLLLANTTTTVLATGIANIHARDPMAMANGAKALGEAYPNRFVLGIGVSHAPSVQMRGGDYANPLAQMTAYLDAMDSAQYAAPTAAEPVPLMLAALGPKMLELAAERTDGGHPYFAPVEHTPMARKHLGPDACLATEVTAVLTTDRSDGLEIARTFAKNYLVLPNYANNLRRLGWPEHDIDNATEPLIDAVVAIGDVDAIVRRVNDHLDAGADHVCVQIRAERSHDPSIEAYKELAAAFGL
jgi:probable F420-dependent oxidoreductase